MAQVSSDETNHLDLSILPLSTSDEAVCATNLTILIDLYQL